MHTRTLALVAALAAATPVAADAQWGGGVPPRNTRAIETPAYRAGYERGIRRGEDDSRGNQRYDYAGKSDYRNGDAGYRRDYGDRERYRLEFRVGFETGYREGFEQFRPGYGRANGWRQGASGPPPWATARGRGSYPRTDLAFRTGFTDGYEAGLREGRDRDRFDPIREGRYRSGDHGYNRSYGSRDFYRVRFREGFLEGYEHGYNDGWRYDARYDGRNRNNRPGWWPW